MNVFKPSNTETAIYMLVGLIIGVIFHEVMHGYVAYRFGDMTAKNAGRLTLDPIAHIDPFGTLILPGILLLLKAHGPEQLHHRLRQARAHQPLRLPQALGHHLGIAGRSR